MVKSLTMRQRRKGMRLIYSGQLVGPIISQLLMVSAFGVLLIRNLGGSAFQAMLLCSLLALPRILQIPVSLVVPPSRGKRFMVNAWVAGGLLFAAALLVTFLGFDAKIKVWLLLIFIGLASCVNMVGTTFWFPLLHDIVPEDQRGRFFGKMRTLWTGSTFLVIVLTAIFLGPHPVLWKFQVVFAILLLLFFVRIIFIARIQDGSISATNNDYSNWKRYIRHVLSRKRVLNFWLYYSLLGFFAGFLSTPLVLYMSYKGFAVNSNIITFGFRTLGQALLLLLAGVLTDRIGTKRVFFIGHLILFAVCFSVVQIGWMPLSRIKYLLPCAFIVSGGMIAMTNVACITQVFHLAPDRGRAFFMSLSVIITTMGFAISPLVVGYILRTLPDTWNLNLGGISFDIFQFMVSVAGLGMLCLISLLFFIEDVRPGKPLNV